MPDVLVTVLTVGAMVLGFGAIVAIHEFGHFVAARWAGIRVHAFAVGFGRALVSYRKGMGAAVGSSEAAYQRLLAERGLAHDAAGAPSPTEYRLNWIPFGGYVKMLGQEDGNPGAVSDAPDSYLSQPIWKRMVVISAGVVLNVALSAVLFVAVYMAGITSPAPVLGALSEDSPAYLAGLRAGDVIVAVDGERVRELNDLVVRVAMSPGGEDVEVRALRGGEEVVVSATPGTEGLLGSGLRQLGVMTSTSARVWGEPWRASAFGMLGRVMERAGVGGVSYGAELVRVDGLVVREETLADGSSYRRFATAAALIEREGADGVVRLEFEDDAGAVEAFEVPTRAEFMDGGVRVRGVADASERVLFAAEHLFGMMPLAQVASWSLAPPAQGLMPGDVFVRVGSRPYPSVGVAVEEIRGRAGGRVELVVLRGIDGAGGGGELVTIDAEVSVGGQVGFTPDHAWGVGVLGAGMGLSRLGDGGGWESVETAASRLGLEPIVGGTRLVGVIGAEGEELAVDGFGSLRELVRGLTADALESGEGAEVVVVGAVMPADAGAGVVDGVFDWAAGERVEIGLALSAGEVRELHGLGFEVPGLAGVFRPVELVVAAGGPVEAVGMGFWATKRILSQTYLTIKRLFEGSVPVSKLQGPVGITYTGSRFAEQGLVYFLYFLALISANLAVINFLPIPITDGGQFLLLTWEGVRGKPAPIVVQNVLTLMGLVLILSLFVYVTFHDVLRIF